MVSLIDTDLLWFIIDCITLFLAPLASEVSNLFGELSAVLRDADVFEDLLYAEGCESPLAKQTLQQVPRGTQLQVEYPVLLASKIKVFKFKYVFPIFLIFDL